MRRLRELEREAVREAGSTDTIRDRDSAMGICDVPGKEDFDKLIQGGNSTA